MSRKRDIERAEAKMEWLSNDNLVGVSDALELAYDLGRIAGLRRAAELCFPDRERQLQQILRELANREARKLRRK